MKDIHASRSLANQALSNLVNQFARPLDFLRELVQNSLDAGTPRIEVSVDYEAGVDTDGVLSVRVDDFGEGMDERIIDEQLTRLFSSTKEDDLTKIGKFGIGFTSIFAIRPDAVLVHTGRHGEFWELLFHKDRSFEKVRVDKPVTGTRITLFKRTPSNEVEAFVREARYVLGYWCEHSDTPITFQDRTKATKASATTDSADPFAAFDQPTPIGGGPQMINRPFALHDAKLQVEHQTQTMHMVVGAGGTRRFGYYNGGLTLVNSRNANVLGTFDERLGHLSFKVKADSLEHTLTRDNVLQDSSWQDVMTTLVSLADTLRSELLDGAERAISTDEPMDIWYAMLTAEASVSGSRTHPFQLALRKRELLRGHRELITLESIESQERWLGRLLAHPGDGPLADAIHADKVAMVRVDDATRALLMALEPPRRLGLLPAQRNIIDAGRRFLLPQLVNEQDLAGDERRLIRSASALLTHATRRGASLAVGDFASDDGHDLCVEGPRDGRLFERKGDGWLRLPLFLRRRCLLVNRRHPHYRALVAASMVRPSVASLALAQALLIYEGIEPESTFQRLFERAAEVQA